MRTVDIDTISERWLQPGQNHLQRLLHRSSTLRTTSLVLVHAAGCALMLLAPLALAVATGSALHLLDRVQGPLDWFAIEVLGAIGLLSAYLSYQLFLLSPAQPRGVSVSASSAPLMHDMLDRRAAHFKMKAINNILLTTKAELRIVAAPVLPLPFLHSYTLCAGAPLMLFLSREQFRLALTGAVAATAACQSSLSGWMKQACIDWPIILDALSSKNNLLSRLLTRPLQLVVSASNALGRPLHTDWRRQQGEWVLENSDEENVVNFLANQIVAAAFLQKQYWPMILKAAERCPTPVVKAFSHLPLLLNKTLNQQLAERWLMQSQAPSEQQQTGVRDLLADLRIDHLCWSGLPHQNAFDDLFETNSVLKDLDALWQQDIEPEWRRRHAHFQSDQIRFRQLQKQAAKNGLRGESALRYLKLAPHFLEMSATLSLYHKVYNNNRDDAKVCFAAGLALLRAGANEEGSNALKRAATLEPSLAKRAQALIKEHRRAWVTEDDISQEAPMQGACA
jgi:hypothetical protein